MTRIPANKNQVREYGISPQVGYKWSRRFVQNGPVGMSDFGKDQNHIAHAQRNVGAARFGNGACKRYFTKRRSACGLNERGFPIVEGWQVHFPFLT